MRRKVLTLGCYWNQIRGDFASDSVVAFEVEYSEDRQFRTGTFVSIGLVEAVWVELFKVKELVARFSKESFAVLAFFL